MGRLISEDDVMRMLTSVELNNGTITDAKIELRNVKTAYDVEKVVEELKGQIILNNNENVNLARTKAIMDCVKIVRKGGVE